MTMIERVAAAIETAWVESANQPGAAYDTKILARAAIAAMREPTEAMIIAYHPLLEFDSTQEEATFNWQVMIDAALEEK
jgi:hypothetical protein